MYPQNPRKPHIRNAHYVIFSMSLLLMLINRNQSQLTRVFRLNITPIGNWQSRQFSPLTVMTILGNHQIECFIALLFYLIVS